MTVEYTDCMWFHNLVKWWRLMPFKSYYSQQVLAVIRVLKDHLLLKFIILYSLKLKFQKSCIYTVLVVPCSFDTGHVFHWLTDVDECSTVLFTTCHGGQQCINTLGSFLCQCKTGYTYNTSSSLCEGTGCRNYVCRDIFCTSIITSMIVLSCPLSDPGHEPQPGPLHQLLP